MSEPTQPAQAPGADDQNPAEKTDQVAAVQEPDDQPAQALAGDGSDDDGAVEEPSGDGQADQVGDPKPDEATTSLA